MHHTTEPSVNMIATRYETSQYGQEVNIRDRLRRVWEGVVVRGGARYFAVSGAEGLIARAWRPEKGIC